MTNTRLALGEIMRSVTCAFWLTTLRVDHPLTDFLQVWGCLGGWGWGVTGDLPHVGSDLCS